MATSRPAVGRQSSPSPLLAYTRAETDIHLGAFVTQLLGLKPRQDSGPSTHRGEEAKPV